jgi:hypothetical protein
MQMRQHLRTALHHEPITRLIQRVFQRGGEVVLRRALKHGRQQLMNGRVITGARRAALHGIDRQRRDAERPNVVVRRRVPGALLFRTARI